MAKRPVVRQNQIGLVIEGTIYEGGTIKNISGATGLTMRLLKGDGTVLTKTASFTTDGSDGKLKYVTVSGDLDTPGSWEWELQYTLSGATVSTERAYFHVTPIIS